MKKNAWLIIFIIVFFCLSKTAAGHGDLSAGETALLVNISGTVLVQYQSDSWEYVYTERIVKGGTQIWVLEDSIGQISFPDGTDFRLYENTNIYISLMEKSDAENRSIFSIIYGKLKATVSELSGDNDTFEVHSPTSTTSIRGTDFEIEVSKDSQNKPVTSLNVLEGIVEIASLKDGLLGNFTSVLPGNAVQVELNGKILKFDHLLPLLNENELKFWIKNKIENEINIPINIQLPWD